MTMKKVPGAGEVYMVYDARDRLVMIQDAKLRANSYWLVTKYDDLDRPAETGILYSSTPFNTHLLSAGTNINYPSTASAFEQLTVTHYDNYNGLPAGLSDYITTWDGYFSATDNINWPYPQMPLKSMATKGMVTWTQTKIEGTSSYINTVIYYDAKGRIIQLQSTNIAGGINVTTTQYSWAGQPLLSVQKLDKPGTNAQTIVALTKFTYDDLGRLLKSEKAVSSTLVNGGAMPAFKTIAENQYDKLGQLKKKVLAPAFAGGGLENLNYEYNIRGWMLGMNRDYAKDAATANYFGFDLGYDKMNNGIIGGQTYSTPQYNGNIEGMVWKSRGDGEKRKYDFVYDAVNRLLRADFKQYTGGSFNQLAGVNYDIIMGDGTNTGTAYDNNGNIKRMQQWGFKITGSAKIDDLTYLYKNFSNRLAKVTESATGGTPAGSAAGTGLGDFKDGTNTGDDYDYDTNGNLSYDNNKSISSITYNHLNLPVVITVTGKGTVTYTYDAAGNKLQKTTVDNTVVPSKVTNTQYIGGAVFENDVLQFLGHEEGRIRYSLPVGGAGGGLQYDYMLKDHLGNVRMMLTEEQQQDKYPVASMEDVKISTEQNYYTVNTANIVTANTLTGLPAYTNDNGIGNNPADAAFSAANSQKLYKLNSNTNKTGLGITLKVMAGDKIDIFGKSYYFQNNTGGSGANVAIPVLELLSGLLGTPGGATAGGHTSATELSGITGVTNPLSGTSYLADPLRDNASYTQRPRAFINYVFLDEQFKFVAGGFSAVNNTPGLKNHFSELQNKVAQKNGYVYIYVSNESPVNVFFDNLQVVHTRGAILEESHYYPFGLTMNGISSRALNGAAENKIKYNGYELNKEFDLNLHETFYRSHDPQLGRFWQLDPKPTEFESLYAAMGNNPIFKFDILGDTVYNANQTDDATIVKWIGEDLKLQKGQVNPFSFNKIGDLQVNNKAYNKLSKEQKEIGQNILDAIKSPHLIEIQLVDNNQVLETETVKLGPNEIIAIIGGKNYKDGDVVNKTIETFGGGRVKPPVINGNGPGSNYILAQVARQPVAETVKSVTGNKTANENSVILAHEAFGHVVYHYIQNSCTQNQQTIEYENKIRTLRNMPLRSGTDHPKDRDY
jgi:RHS repeat-associated protein